MTSRVRDELDRYLQRMPNAREARLNDPQYHWQMQWAQRMLELLDLALDNEGIPEDTRVRVIRTVLYGTADESEAMRRIDQTQRLTQEAMERRRRHVDLIAQTRRTAPPSTPGPQL
ncbi:MULTISPECIES: hypothetical protein [unclassified Micromonospora]|uniref:hypothetical protein n=1 Tax=unclassified Micromonospora TaxID=2617518 RepID=UPI00331B8D0C